MITDDELRKWAEDLRRALADPEFQEALREAMENYVPRPPEPPSVWNEAVPIDLDDYKA